MDPEQTTGVVNITTVYTVRPIIKTVNSCTGTEVTAVFGDKYGNNNDPVTFISVQSYKIQPQNSNISKSNAGQYWASGSSDAIIITLRSAHE